MFLFIMFGNLYFGASSQVDFGGPDASVGYAIVKKSGLLKISIPWNIITSTLMGLCKITGLGNKETIRSSVTVWDRIRGHIPFFKYPSL